MDQLARRCVELQERIRAFLIATMPHESPAAIASALTYELASIIAAVTETEAEAQELLRHMYTSASKQITELGVGRQHP
jgi:hypothetical protein